MRPQRNAAENGEGRGVDGCGDQASMRPQRNAAENICTMIGRMEFLNSFNEAAA